MNSLKLKLKYNGKDRNGLAQVNEIFFDAPEDLLLAGFKFVYLTPEPVEDEVFRLCSKEKAFAQMSKSNCLEESLFNGSEAGFSVSEGSTQLNVDWRQRED